MFCVAQYDQGLLKLYLRDPFARTDGEIDLEWNVFGDSLVRLRAVDCRDAFYAVHAFLVSNPADIVHAHAQTDFFSVMRSGETDVRRIIRFLVVMKQRFG